MHLCVAILCHMRGKKALRETVCCAHVHFTPHVDAALVAQHPGEVTEAAPNAQQPGDDVDAAVAALVEQRRRRSRSRKPQQPHLLRGMLMMSPQLRLVVAQVEETSGKQSLPRSMRRTLWETRWLPSPSSPVDVAAVAALVAGDVGEHVGAAPVVQLFPPGKVCCPALG